MSSKPSAKICVRRASELPAKPAEPVVHVRPAELSDIVHIRRLLEQVLDVHARIRPDYFLPGTRKYTDEELVALIADSTRPIFVAQEAGGPVLGHAFCEIQDLSGAHNLVLDKSIYIDDICVDKNARGKHVGTALYTAVCDYARFIGCKHLTLNVWEGNDAAYAFYEAMGMTVQKTTLEAWL